MTNHVPSGRDRYLIVEVHDIEPSRLAQVRAILNRLDQIGARPLTLLVIPAGLASSNPRGTELIDLLAREQASGSEVVLHGYNHSVAGSFHGRPWDVLRARLFAPGVAEFLSIDRDEARRRLEAGRRILADAGLTVSGFCAPGWLEATWLPALLAELGFRYDVGMSVLRDLTQGTRRWLPWVGEIGAGPMHEALISFGGTACLQLGARQPGLKVFMHTTEIHGSAKDRIFRILERELYKRRPITYGSLLGHS